MEVMNTSSFEPVFTEEQLNKMSREDLARVILLMQEQQVKMEEKVSDLQIVVASNCKLFLLKLPCAQQRV